MSAALMTISVLAATTLVAAAQHPFNVIGEGLLSKPYSINGQPGKGVRYAGPVVYTNEKPPMIFFPPPPKDAKPGFGGLSIFGKNKAPKSIKYVPMPHHDLPVLIYTSDKMPPIHVVQPSNVQGSTPFGSPREIVRPPTGSLSSTYRGVLPPPPPSGSLSSTYRGVFSPPPSGSLSSTYRGILPEANSPRIVSSSYEIPSTSYGTPMKAFGSALGSLDLSSSVAANTESSEPTSNNEYEQPPVYNVVSNSIRTSTVVGPPGSNKKALPNILYNGQPPIHVFNHPEMFVQAPKELPLKTFADMPPKASFGPPKSSFGPPSGNSFIGSHSHTLHRHHYRTLPSPSSFGSPYSRLSPKVPSKEILIPSESSHSPSTSLPCSQKTAKAENNEAAASTSHATVQSPGKPSTYAFKPPQTMFSFGPFSIEYGPPEEPFMSFSEPTGSLTSLYGSINDRPVASESGISENINTNAVAEQEQQQQQELVRQQQQQQGDDEGWMPGPPPDFPEEQMKEEVYDAPMPPPLPPMSQPQHQQLGLRRPKFRGPRPIPMHNSVLLPSAGPHGFQFGSRLAHFLSAFKLKRSKPKYAIAPKSMHKPPIIIYYGKKPPVHVYQKPEGDYGTETAASSTSNVVVSAVQPSSSADKGINNDSSGNSKEAIQSEPVENVELSYAGSQDSEVRVAAPLSSSNAPLRANEQPAIIPARPVDIFSSADLQPSIYMARNTLNTILVSDLTGSGSNTIKTYIVRNSENSPSNFDTVQRDYINNNNDRSIPIAEDRISGEMARELQSSNAPEQVEETLADNEDNNASSSNDEPPTIVLAVGSPPKQEEVAVEEEIQPEASEPEVARIQSPSSFQTSLSQAEKDAEEGASAEASSS